MKHEEQDETIEMRVYMPKAIHRLLMQRQENHRQKQLPFKPLYAFVVDATIDGLHRESYFEQMCRERGIKP